MTTPTINTFRHETDVVTFAAGQTLFSEGDPGDVMYVVQEGEVDIVIQSRLVETVGPGGWSARWLSLTVPIAAAPLLPRLTANWFLSTKPALKCMFITPLSLRFRSCA